MFAYALTQTPAHPGGTDATWTIFEDDGRTSTPTVLATCPIPHTYEAPAPLVWAMAVTGQPRTAWTPTPDRGWISTPSMFRRVAAILNSDVTYVGVGMVGGLLWQPLDDEDAAQRWLAGYRRGPLRSFDTVQIMSVDEVLGLTTAGRRTLARTSVC